MRVSSCRLSRNRERVQRQEMVRYVGERFVRVHFMSGTPLANRPEDREACADRRWRSWAILAGLVCGVNKPFDRVP